jgi:hypothetical protein
MQKRFQLGQTARQQPVWLRLIAMMCLALICVASTAQVCHSHMEVARSSKDSRNTVPAPDHCPLCVAMHSALPTSANTAPEPVIEIQMVLFKAVELQRLRSWSFDLFSRPPPVMPSIA